jgi:diacylglycerol kinase (ATP)
VSAAPHIALVVNPRAGKGRVGRELQRLVALVEAVGARARIMATDRPGHATDLAREAALDGADTVVAVGGDGTVNEVVNGLVADDAPAGKASLGVVAAGSGCDFARTFALPKDVDHDLRGVVGETRPLDVGKIVCAGPDGPITRYFVNVAEAGMGAATVERAIGYPRWMGRSRYVVAFWPALIAFRPVEMTVTTPENTYTATAHNVLVANARYVGGGMHISPASSPSDGILDAQVNVGPKRQAVTLIPKFFRGTHLPDPRITQLSAAEFRIDAAEPVPVEADGELVGRTPATVTVLPGLLTMRE